MYWIDIVIGVIVVSLIIHGIATGLIRGVFDIAGLVFGYVIAVSYSSFVRMPQIIAFLLIFIVTMILFSIAGRLVSKMIHVTPLGFVDRILGAAFGFIKGLMICFVFLLTVMYIRRDSRVLSGSQFAPPIVNIGLTASSVLPRPLHEWIQNVFFRKDIALDGEDDNLSV